VLKAGVIQIQAEKNVVLSMVNIDHLLIGVNLTLLFVNKEELMNLNLQLVA